MSFPRKASWHRLPLTTSIPSAPALLVRTEFTSSSFTIFITDLCQVWTETLGEEEIRSRAASEGTTIDPSEDESQLPVLLDKLETALRRASRDTQLELSSVANENVAQGCDLLLKLGVKLPPPLPRLEWTFRLTQGSAIDFTNRFVLPLISMASTHTEVIEDLLTIIAEKDKVIEKLKDSLVEGNANINMIVGTRRRKALQEFDRKAWESDAWDVPNRKPGEVVGDVFGEERKYDAGQIQNIKPSAEEWWRGVEEESPAAPRKTGPERSARNKSPEKAILSTSLKEEPADKKRWGKGRGSTTSNSDDEDGFEIRQTPERRSAARAHGDDAKVSKKPDSDTDVPSPRKPPTAKKGIGKLGDKRKTASSQSETLAHETSTADADDEETDDDDIPPPRKPPTTKKGIGKLGDKEKTASSQSEAPAQGANTADADEETEDEDVSPPREAPTTKKGIGKLGGTALSPSKPPAQKTSTSGVKITDADEETEDDDLDAKIPAFHPPKPEVVEDRKNHITAGHMTASSGDEVRESALGSPQKKRTIGKIGGSKSFKQVAQQPESETEAVSKKTGGVKRGGGIGRIGRKKAAGNDVEMQDAPEESRGTPAAGSSRIAPPEVSLQTTTKTKIEKPSPEPDNEDERADRKRRQLEKELEAKKKGPQKKKRRF